MRSIPGARRVKSDRPRRNARMRKVQWIFFSYVALVVLVIVGIAVSFAVTPPRRIDTLCTFYGANIKSLDPAEIGDTESDAIANNIFECLYNYRRGVRPYT